MGMKTKDLKKRIAALESEVQGLQEDKHRKELSLRKIRKKAYRQGLYLSLMLEILKSQAEADGLSLISSQQLNSPSTERNENVRMLFQRIRELG